MLNKIITGIAQTLDSEFNSEENQKYTIYAEDVKQGLEEPCFFIFSLKPSNKQLVGNRYKRNYTFDIHYFPEDESNYNNEITERLFMALEYITLDSGLIRGTNMNAEIVDNVLHFFINYNMIVRKDIPKEDPMKNLKVNLELKG
ncbi:hypothetical protein CLPUN_02960 [Clostridium puniceum]|uniref:Phage protein n=1 Tax=Clostridium puniceum TaxID=29367 RepID=A0A1S8TX64_9CLOT|nr:hypothetical protein [Clostridium puniceum]OOM82327.1 hypothetical protein CLPUN_02960 [Clostridium puniceum]